MANNLFKNKNRTLIPGYTLIPEGDHLKIRKISLTGERVKKDPNFHLTRLANREFTYAQQILKLVRQGVMCRTKHKAPTGPLTRLIMDAMHQDDTSGYGLRNLIHGDAPALENHQFNQYCNLQESLPYTASIDCNQQEGIVTILPPAFNSAQSIRAPEQATSFLLYTVYAAIGLGTMTVMAEYQESRIYSIKSNLIKPEKQVYALQKGQPILHITAMGIAWATGARQEHKLLPASQHNPLAIIKAWKTNT